METTFIREVTLRYRGQGKKLFQIREASNAAEFFRKVLPDNVREHFLTLFLDGAHQVIGYSLVATGTANMCPVGIREVFQPAVILGACALICGHNHPSNNTEPSSADRQVTNSLRAGGELLGIKLLDHVIISEDEFYSFQEHGAL
jgi:DNA repair protein RadC